MKSLGRVFEMTHLRKTVYSAVLSVFPPYVPLPVSGFLLSKSLVIIKKKKMFSPPSRNYLGGPPKLTF